MGKFKRRLSGVLSVLFTVFTMLSYMPAQAAVAKTQPIVSGMVKQYTIGDAAKLKLTASNTSYAQYRVYVQDLKTKKTVEITKDYTKSVKANIPYIVTLPTSKVGDYKVTVYARKSGSKEKYEGAKTLAYKVVNIQPVISGLLKQYMAGTKARISLTTKNAINVQYRVFVQNLKTKITTEITKGATKSMKASTPYVISVPMLSDGNCKLIVYAIKSGTKYQSSVVLPFTVNPKAPVATTQVLDKEGAAYGSSDSNKPQNVNGDVKIAAKNITYSNVNINGNLFIDADNAALNNVNVTGKLVINPGKDGSTNLNNVQALNIEVLSGGENSIHFNGVNAQNLTVDSESNVRIETKGATSVGSTIVESYAILDSNGGSLGEITVTKNDKGEYTVEFRGTFTEPVVVETQATIKAAENASIPKVEVAPETSDATIKLEGTFKEVEVSKEAKVEVAENSTIRDSLKVMAPAEIKAAATAEVTQVEVATANKDANVKIAGTIGLVNVQSAAKIEVAEGAKANIVTNAKNVEVSVAKGSTVALDTKGNNTTISGDAKNNVAKTDLSDLVKAVDNKVSANKAEDAAKAAQEAAAKAAAEAKTDAEKAEAAKAAQEAKAAADKAAADKAAADKAAQDAAKKAEDAAKQANAGSSSNSGSTPISVSSVLISPSTATLVVGKKLTLEAVISPSNASQKGITWTSSDESIATVDASGIVTGKNEGNVVITATTIDGHKTATCTITVNLEELQGNMWIQTTKEDFEKGINNGTVITKNGDGEIQLVGNNGSYTTGGIYTSETIKMPKFEYLVLSWNADTPKGTSITIEGQVRANGKWSNWRSWGTWSSSMDKASSSVETSHDSDVAYVDTDTLTVKGSDGETGDEFRYRVILNTNNSSATPSVRLIAATLRNTLSGQAINKVYNDGITQEQLDNLDKTIDVPVYSQMVRDPSFADYICSATSIAMLLKYRGIDILPEQSAMGTYDSEYDGYGNWPFSTAYAGNYGFTTYVEYEASMDDLKREIINGNPVAISVKYRNDESVPKSYPVVHGAPIPSTGGHLVVVCGFTKVDGKDYVVVNDAAAANDSGVRLKYLQSEFDAAWASSGRVAYIVHPAVPGDGTAKPEILQSTLEPTGQTKNVDGKISKEYELKCNGQKVNLDKVVNPDNPNYEKGISIMYKLGEGAYSYVNVTTDKTLWLDTTIPTGTYDFLVFKKTGDSYRAQLDWVNPKEVHSTYTITQTGVQDSYTTGDLIDKTKSQEEINATVENAVKALTPINVNLKSNNDEGLDYQKVRIQPVNAGENIQLWAKDTNGNWYDINAAGWGPENGFALPAIGYDETTPVYVISNKAGDYTLNVNLVDLASNNTPIQSSKKTIKVVDQDVLQGNMWIQTAKEDFEKGINNGTVITKNGDGEIQLVGNNGSYTTGGIYTSETIKMPKFEYLVLSWNADTPKGTSITIEGQVRANGKWSNWRSWGTWSSSMDKASSSVETSHDSDVAFVDTDTLTVKGSDGETGDEFRYRVILNTNDSSATPSVRLIAATLRNTLSGQAINKVYNDGITQEQLDNLDKTIDVPVYSQMVRDPQFASSICSSTSIAMLLKYRGIDILPEQSAMGTYDSVYDGYGNWPFATAYAGSYGFTTYVEYEASMDDLKREIINGNPVAVSVQYQNNEDVGEGLPVVHGAPISYTWGHLVVVVGFTKGSDGKDYIVVNDAAAANDAGVRRQYLVSEFDAAWARSGRIAYIVHPAVPGDGTAKPEILQSTLEPTGQTKNVDGKISKEYELKCNGQKVNLDKVVNPDNPNYEKGISIMYKLGEGAYSYVNVTTDKTLWLDTTIPTGTYDFLVFKKTGDSYKAQIDWTNPNELHSTYTITQTGAQESYTTGDLIDKTKSQEEVNAALENAVKVLIPINVNLKSNNDEGLDYQKVRIQPVNAGENIQLWAKDTNGNWYDINAVGWGPENGFKLPASGYDETTPVYVISDKAGDYEFNISLVDLTDNTVIQSSKQTINIAAEEASETLQTTGTSEAQETSEIPETSNK